MRKFAYIGLSAAVVVVLVLIVTQNAQATHDEPHLVAARCHRAFRQAPYKVRHVVRHPRPVVCIRDKEVITHLHLVLLGELRRSRLHHGQLYARYVAALDARHVKPGQARATRQHKQHTECSQMSMQYPVHEAPSIYKHGRIATGNFFFSATTMPRCLRAGTLSIYNLCVASNFLPLP